MALPGRGQRGMTLIELLVTMTIMVIVSTMVIMTWSALQNSYSYTISSDQARNAARDAVERMRREVRAMQPTAVGGVSVVQASANEIRFTTAFNDFAADTSGRIRLTRYYYQFDSAQAPSQWRIFRQRDTNDDGSFTSADRTIMIADNVSNGRVPSTSAPTAIFTYTYIDSAGVAQTATSVAGADNLKKIVQVQIRVITDVNPAHAPSYFDLVTTVRPRNAQD
jgi:prepilin-type N-terminal cleavage/methylation domain-containing protein